MTVIEFNESQIWRRIPNSIPAIFLKSFVSWMMFHSAYCGITYQHLTSSLLSKKKHHALNWILFVSIRQSMSVQTFLNSSESVANCEITCDHIWYFSTKQKRPACGTSRATHAAQACTRCRRELDTLLSSSEMTEAFSTFLDDGTNFTQVHWNASSLNAYSSSLNASSLKSEK